MGLSWGGDPFGVLVDCLVVKIFSSGKIVVCVMVLYKRVWV